MNWALKLKTEKHNDQFIVTDDWHNSEIEDRGPKCKFQGICLDSKTYMVG